VVFAGENATGAVANAEVVIVAVAARPIPMSGVEES
jgi:hypothetical protein